jgi:hypothetical protein
MRATLLVLLTCLALLGSALAKPGGNPYEVIDKQAQADAVMKDVLATMGSSFGLRLKYPVQLYLVEPEVMDRLFKESPYKGAEVGLYTGIKNGKHQLYVMKGWGRDQCAGITCHELTHAWQAENAPLHQEQVLKEGYAMYVEYKYYDLIGAYSFSERIRQTADPVYGVGFFAVLDAESVVGPSKMADLMRQANGVKDLPKKKK